MNYALIVLSLAATFFTFAPLSTIQIWWIRGWDFPRVQLAVLLFLLLVLQGILFEQGNPAYSALFTMTFIALGYQLWWIIPYTRLFPIEVPDADPSPTQHCIGILIANVYMHNRNSNALLARIDSCNPEIIVTLETDQRWQDDLSVLANDYPYRIECPQDNLYGMHVYSKLPLIDPQIEFLVEADVPSMHAQVRLDQQTVAQLHFVHPAPPSPTENEESTQRDAELVLIARRVTDCKLPVIVTGDLNDVAWSATTRLFRKISGLLDPRVGRGMFNTFHAKYWPIRWPLDHLFHSHDFRLAEIRRLPAFGSDHFALFTRLCYSHKPVRSDAGLSASESDRKLAKEKIHAADELATSAMGCRYTGPG